MFSRVSSLSSTCLKCQRGLAVHNRVCRPHIVQKFLPPGQRWQSAPALYADDDSIPQQVSDYEPVGWRKTQDISAYKKTARRAKRDEREARRQRRHKAEELGINVLGKPAEVLILPTRKRKIAKIVEEQDESREKIDLQKSLTSESEPISLKEALKNIELLKSELEKEDYEYSAVEWKELKKRLSDGFTMPQLQEYLRTALDYDKSNAEAPPLPSHKRQLASQIMHKVWKWKCQYTKVPKSEEPPIVTKRFYLQPMTMDYLMLHCKEKLRNLSKLCDVQIDIYRKTKVLQFSGTFAAVKNAGLNIAPFLRSVNGVTFKLYEDLQEFFKDRPKSKLTLDALMQKYRVFLEYHGESIAIAGIRRASFKDAVTRDLFLLSGKFRTLPHASICLQQDQGPILSAPVYPDELPGWLTRDKDWFRLVSESTDVHWDDKSIQRGRREARKLAEDALKLDKLDPDAARRFNIHPGTLTDDYSVDLAQVLFTDSQPENINAEMFSNDRPAIESVLTVQPAMLPQVLEREPFVPAGAPESLHTDHYHQQQRQEKVPFQLHLRFKPITQTNIAPDLEFWISGEDANLGLQQKIRINRACAVLGLWQENLLLPHRPLDIVLRRESKIELLGNQHVEIFPPYMKVLKQVYIYLRDAQLTKDAALPAIWKLDISPLLNPKPEEPVTEADFAAGPEPKRRKVSKREKEARLCTYILEPPERLDVKSYFSIAGKHTSIDHIQYETEPKEKPRQRQAIRISHPSLPRIFDDQPDEKTRAVIKFDTRHRWFHQAVIAAYDLATAIHRAGEDVGKIGTGDKKGSSQSVPPEFKPFSSISDHTWPT